MKTSYKFFVVAFLGITICTAGCKKENSDTNPLAEMFVEDDESSGYFDEILAEVDDVTINVSKGEDKGNESGVRQVTTTTSGDTTIHTVVYTNYTNNNSPRQRIKNGTIIIKRIGHYNSPIFWRRVSFQNFSINGNVIEGVKTISKTADYQYNVSLENIRITFTDQTTYTRNATRSRTWVSGYNTPLNIWDDVYQISGTATGTNRRNQNYTHTISSPIVIKLNCRWITQGVINATIGQNNVTIDYGDGTCDNIAMVTINGKTYEIRLR